MCRSNLNCLSGTYIHAKSMAFYTQGPGEGVTGVTQWQGGFRRAPGAPGKTKSHVTEGRRKVVYGHDPSISHSHPEKWNKAQKPIRCDSYVSEIKKQKKGAWWAPWAYWASKSFQATRGSQAPRGSWVVRVAVPPEVSGPPGVPSPPGVNKLQKVPGPAGDFRAPRESRSSSVPGPKGLPGPQGSIGSQGS
jgi:hypothetical protein